MFKEEMDTSGVWLFRWRSYVPLGFVVVLFVAMARFTYPLGSHVLDQIWDFLCYGISLCGLAVRIATVGYVPSRTSGRNTKGQVADTLNSTGLYSVLRHPLYFGNFWMWMGVATFPRAWWLPLLAGAAFVLVYERIVCAEEQFLAEKFGEEYIAWANRTPVFWPRLRNWKPPALPFSWRTVLRRENSSFLGLNVIFYALEVSGTLIAERRFEVDWTWTVLFALSVVLYVVLKVLKKRRYLNVTGRS